jgi:hypothetical protein
LGDVARFLASSEFVEKRLSEGQMEHLLRGASAEAKGSLVDDEERAIPENGEGAVEIAGPFLSGESEGARGRGEGSGVASELGVDVDEGRLGLLLGEVAGEEGAEVDGVEEMAVVVAEFFIREEPESGLLFFGGRSPFYKEGVGKGERLRERRLFGGVGQEAREALFIAREGGG